MSAFATRPPGEADPSPGADDWPRAADGELLVGGTRLSRVVASVGATPCYIYDRARIAGTVSALRSRLDPAIRLHYAMKANPMPAVVALLARLTDGLDVASLGEMRVALDAGVPPANIGFAGPGKTDHELACAHAAGVLVNIESFREIDVLGRLSEAQGHAARVALRVNLAFDMKSAAMRMSGGPRQFGIDSEQVEEAMQSIGKRQLAFEGFHLFAGSQNLRAAAIIEAQDRSYDCALGWARRAPAPVRRINLGGGFGIPYALRDPRLDVAPVCDNLNRLAQRASADLPGAGLTLELGRYLVGESGLFVTRVIDRKISRGRIYLVVDGGLNHHLAATGNFGQVIRRNYPVAVNGAASASETVDIVGPLCTPLDLLAEQAEVRRASVGDLVVVFQSGAYGRTASPSRFLGHPEALEALV
jgi:diaminopimelate decarboxylase